MPQVDPLPLPAPEVLFHVLLVATFTLHILAMNVLLGGSVLAAANALLHRLRPDEHRGLLLKRVGRPLTISVAVTVTLGVAPLLFLQLVYGPYFFTSSILMAFPWLSVIGFVIVAYAALYLVEMWSHFLGRWALAVRIAGALTFAGVAFLYVNNATLMLTPDKWHDIYDDFRQGIYLPLNDPQLFPRYLHFLLAALAIGGLAVLVYGLWARRREPAFGDWCIRQGAWWFLVPTALQAAIGPIFLVVQPASVRDEFLSADMLETSVLWAGVASALVAMVLVLWTVRSRAPTLPGAAAVGFALVSVSLMAVTRDLLRAARTSSFLDVSTLPSRTQVGGLIIFLAALMAALGTIAYMLWLLRRGRPAVTDRPTEEPS